MMARVDVFEDDHAYASPEVAVALHAELEEFERVDMAEESGRHAVVQLQTMAVEAARRVQSPAVPLREKSLGTT